jgi:PAS domain S-box-containing protein
MLSLLDQLKSLRRVRGPGRLGRALRYGLALISVAGTHALLGWMSRSFLGAGIAFTVPLSFLAMLTYILGSGPGLAYALLVGFDAWYFFVGPRNSFSISSSLEAMRLAGYFVCALAIVGLSRLQQRTPEKFESRLGGRQTIIALFSFALLIISVVAFGNFWSNRALDASQNLVTHTVEVLADLRGILTAMNDVETGQIGFLLTHNPDYLEPYRNGRSKAYAQWEMLIKKTSDNPRQQENLRKVRPLMDAKFAELSRTIRLDQEGNHSAAIRLLESGAGKKLMDEFRRSEAAMEEEERNLLAARNASVTAQARIRMWFIVGGTMASFFLLYWVLILFLRERTAALLAAVVSHSDDAIIGKTLDGTITAWNPAAEKIFGYKASEVIGHPISLILPPDRKDEVHHLIARIQNGETVSHYETLRQRKDGQLIPVSVTLSPIKDSRGAIIGVSSIKRDITERRRAEEELARHARALTRSNAELEQFAYIASHDLQEPLRAIGGFTGLIGSEYKGKLDANADKYIRFIVEGVARMQTLIDDLLSYSRVGRQSLSIQPVDLKQTVANVLKNLEPRIREKSAKVLIEDMPVVQADEIQMEQLFQNLIGNALKFTGAESPQVTVSSSRKDNVWVISVKDNGIGIDPRFSERIFVPFQRLHERSRYPGNGIGLTICQKIVERHNGRIWVESHPGSGANFLFTIPVKGDNTTHESATQHH